MLRTVIPFQLHVWLSIFLIPCGERNSNGCDWLISLFLGYRANRELDKPFEVVDPDKTSKITQDVKAETDQKQRNQTRCQDLWCSIFIVFGKDDTEGGFSQLRIQHFAKACLLCSSSRKESIWRPAFSRKGSLHAE